MRSVALPVAFALSAATNAHALPTPLREAFQPSAPNVRVLLGRHARAMVSGYDLELNGETVAGTSVFNVRCGSEPGSGAAYVEFGPGRRAIGKLEIRAPGGFLSLNEKAYRNRLTVIPDGEKCAIVNTVDLEKYLAGVIAKEMAPGWPLEALKAQAVAARSTRRITTSKTAPKIRCMMGPPPKALRPCVPPRPREARRSFTPMPHSKHTSTPTAVASPKCPSWFGAAK
jgi:hypothetical protein